VALVIVSYSYQGWTRLCYIGGEVADAEEESLGPWLPGKPSSYTTALLGLNAVFVLGAPASCWAGKVDVGRITAPGLGAGRAPGRSWFSALMPSCSANCISAL